MATNKRLIKSNDEAAGGGDFNTVTYTGNGGTQSITGVGFQPDFVWAKKRSATQDHIINDSVRGVQKELVPNNTSAEYTTSNGLSSFDSDGFTTGANNALNTSGSTYVAWCWKAGGAAVTNTDGTITSQVSANVEAGFSIVKYNLSSPSVSDTIGHGLGVAPEMIITKCTSSTGNWHTYHKDLGTGKHLKLNTTDATATYANGFATVNSTAWQEYFRSDPQSHIAYCFAEVAGFSKFGSYTGNGSTNGPTIDCGFEPAFVMIKASSDAGAWVMHDNKRGNYNDGDIYARVLAESSEAETDDYPTTKRIVLSPTGFQLTNASNSWNGSGRTYIYMAFANQF